MLTNDTLRVLVVDDEISIRRFLRVSLAAKHYTVFEASTGQEGLAAALKNKPDIIVLDLGLPDIDGIEVTRLLRQWTQIPILILSVRGAETDKIAALDAGADDYLTKPFGMGELMARLRATLRRSSGVDEESVFRCGDLTVDLVKRVVMLNDMEVQLTPNEYDILKVLVKHSGKVLTHSLLLKEVWGNVYSNEFHILRVNISNLRRKIEIDPARPVHIITEPGVGYRLKAE